MIGPSVRRRDTGGGFTLLEMVVVLAVLGLLAAAVAPLFAELEEGTRTADTRRRFAAIKRAIVGAPVPEGQSAERPFGFVGDLGALPDSLPQLTLRLGLPAFRVDSATGLGVGWRGPYVAARFAEDSPDLDRDAFGRRIRYSTTGKTVNGVEWAGELRSAGPDGVFDNADDIVAPLLKKQVRSEVHAFLTTEVRRGLAAAPVRLTFRRDGALVDTVVTTDSVGHFTVPDVAVGPVLIQASAGPGGQRTGFEHGSVAVSGNQQNDVEFTVFNVSNGTVELTSLTVFLPDSLTDRCYRSASLAGESLFPSGTNIRCSGETLTFRDTVRMEGGILSPTAETNRRFLADRTVTVGPAAVATGGPLGGGLGRAVLGSWRDEFGSGNPVNMQGVTLRVTFSDGLDVTFTTPGG